MSGNDSAPIVDCAPEFHARVAHHVDAVCLQKGMLPGARVLTVDGGTDRACWCACGPQDGINVVATPAGERPMNTLVCGDAVLGAGAALAWSPVPVRFSGGAVMSQNATALISIALATESGTTLRVVSDHTFLTRSAKLIRARDLGVGDSLLLADGNAAAIVACNLVPAYRGYVWRIATSDDEPKALDAHLLNTGGVVSGDYAVQLFFDALADAGLAHRATSAA
jgi:hypothetical protein